MRVKGRLSLRRARAFITRIRLVGREFVSAGVCACGCFLPVQCARFHHTKTDFGMVADSLGNVLH